MIIKKKFNNTREFIKVIVVSVAVIFALTIIAFFILDEIVYPDVIFVATALSVGLMSSTILGFHDWKPKSKTIQILYYLVVILVVNIFADKYLMPIMYGEHWFENDMAILVLIAFTIPISVHYITNIYYVIKDILFKKK